MECLELYKFESLRIMLTWSNTPSVCYCGLFIARLVALSMVTLQRGGDLKSYSVRRDELVARGSAPHMHHLSVVVVEFADTDTAQKMHYWVDI